MTQRRLKVGDIVDDYCPRERRITDHAVVAMIDDAIRQTRCTACDNEHPYKEARTPRARRKNTPAALYSEVLANVTDEPVRPVPARADADGPAAPAPEAAAGAAPDASSDETAEATRPAADEGPVHRPLIRATLPRPEGTPPPQQRNIPEFTVRQSNMRGRFRDEFRGGFRGAQGGAQGRNGNQQGQGRPGRPGRPGGGSPNPHARPRRGRPSPHKKRSR